MAEGKLGRNLRFFSGFGSVFLTVRSILDYDKINSMSNWIRDVEPKLVGLKNELYNLANDGQNHLPCIDKSGGQIRDTLYCDHVNNLSNAIQFYGEDVLHYKDLLTQYNQDLTLSMLGGGALASLFAYLSLRDGLGNKIKKRIGEYFHGQEGSEKYESGLQN